MKTAKDKKPFATQAQLAEWRVVSGTANGKLNQTTSPVQQSTPQPGYY